MGRQQDTKSDSKESTTMQTTMDCVKIGKESLPGPNGINGNQGVTKVDTDQLARKRERDENAAGINASAPPEAKHFCPTISPQISAAGQMLSVMVSPEIRSRKPRLSCGEGNLPRLREPTKRVNCEQDRCLKRMSEDIFQKDPISFSGEGKSRPSGPSGTDDGLLDLLQKRDSELVMQFERMRALNGKSDKAMQKTPQSKMEVASGSIEALFGDIEWIRKLRNGAFLVRDQMLVRLADAEEAVDILRKESELTKRDYKRVLARVRVKYTDQLAKIRAEQDETVENIHREHSATLALLQLEMDKMGKEIEHMRQDNDRTDGPATEDKMESEEACTETKAVGPSLLGSHEKIAFVQKAMVKLKAPEELVEQLQMKLEDAIKTIEGLRSAENVHRNKTKELKEKHSHQLAEISSSKEGVIQQIRNECSALVSEKENAMEGLQLEHDTATLDLKAKLDSKDVCLRNAERNATEQAARIQLVESQLATEKDQREKDMEQCEKEKSELLVELSQKNLHIDHLTTEHVQNIANLTSAHKNTLECIVMDKEATISSLRAKVEGMDAARGLKEEQREEQYAKFHEVESNEGIDIIDHHDQSYGQQHEQLVDSDCRSEVAKNVAGAVNKQYIAAALGMPASTSTQNTPFQEGTEPLVSGFAMESKHVVSKNSDAASAATKHSLIPEDSILDDTQHHSVMEKLNKQDPSEFEHRSVTNQLGPNPPDTNARPEEVDVAAAVKEGKMEEECTLREQIDSLLQTTVPQEVKSRFRQIAFAEWTGQWLPAIELGPYDVTPGPMRKQWAAMAEKHASRGSPIKRMVYWYGVRNMMEAYSFLPPSRVISYEEGVRSGYDEIPAKLQAKLESGDVEGKKKNRLSPSEKHRVNALVEMRWEANLEPHKRLSWAKWD